METNSTRCLFCAIQLACEVLCLMPTFLKLPAKITKLSSSWRVIKMWKKLSLNTLKRSCYFRQERSRSRKLLRRSCDTDFIGPSWGLAVIRHRISGHRGSCFLLLLLSFIPFSFCTGPTSTNPRRELQTWLWRERLLQNLEDTLDLQQRAEVRLGHHTENEKLKRELRVNEAQSDFQWMLLGKLSVFLYQNLQETKVVMFLSSKN